MRLSLICCLGLLTSGLWALDVSGDQAPSYLDQDLRPQWRNRQYSEIAADLEQFLQVPVVLSESLQTSSETVFMTSFKATEARAVLALLEETQGVHATAGQLALRLESSREHRDRQRRWINLNVRDYGVWIEPRDHEARRAGFDRWGSVSGFSIMEADFGSDDEALDAETLAGWMQSFSPESGVDVGALGSLYAFVTPGEEGAMVAFLQRRYAAVTSQQRWRIVYGVAPQARRIEAGIVSRASATALIDGLDRRGTFVVNALQGQQVAAERLRERQYLADVDLAIAGDDQATMDPDIRSILLGASISLRPVRGRATTLIDYRFSWAQELGPDQQTVVGQQQRVQAPTATVHTTMSAAKDDEAASAAASLVPQPAVLRPALEATLDLPRIWCWHPAGQAYLADGRALVQHVPCPDGLAVLVIMEVE